MSTGPLPESVLREAPPTRAELDREPFDDDAPLRPDERGSITRPVGPRTPPAGVDADGVRIPWPPRTSGPLPRGWQTNFADVNVVTALDELDIWAAELDRQADLYARSRRAYGLAKGRYELECAKARRVARSNPVERGRRTAADIDGEVVEAVHAEHVLYLDAESEMEVAKTLMFAARDQMERLRSAVSAAKVIDPRGA